MGYSNHALIILARVLPLLPIFLRVGDELQEYDLRSKFHFQTHGYSLTHIKSVIDCDGATCRNNNHFEHPTMLNAP